MASANQDCFPLSAAARAAAEGQPPLSRTMVVGAMKTHISKTAQRLEDEVESRPWHGWPGIIAWRWVGRANKLDINFFGHKLGASANMIYWF